LNTIKVVDRILSVETPSGTLYHRYNEDGYGEQADGGPFTGSGIGRGWPILVGERGHLALQAGEDPLPYLETMHRCASRGGLLPEQVWDSPAIDERGLFPGRPSGSAMPLLWSHAEFLKLLLAREHGRPIEMLHAVEAHFSSAQSSPVTKRHWRADVPLPRLERGIGLLIEDSRPFTLHWGVDHWQRVQDVEAVAGAWGLWVVEFHAEDLSAVSRLDFTRRYSDGWEDKDHSVEVG
jgi:glucoamylase